VRHRLFFLSLPLAAFLAPACHLTGTHGPTLASYCLVALGKWLVYSGVPKSWVEETARLELVYSKPRIFISYSHRDKAFARRLAADLRDQGVLVWIDEDGLQVGDSLPRTIAEAINASQFVGVVLSTHSVNSSWVQTEIEIAINEQFASGEVKILPLLLADCTLPSHLDHLSWLDFRTADTYLDNLDKLVGRIHSKGGNSLG